MKRDIKKQIKEEWEIVSLIVVAIVAVLCIFYSVLSTNDSDSRNVKACKPAKPLLKENAFMFLAGLPEIDKGTDPFFIQDFSQPADVLLQVFSKYVKLAEEELKNLEASK